MKKPYFYLKTIMLIVFLLLMQTSFAQEVDMQQQLNTEVTTVTDEGSGHTVSVLGESRATGDMEEIANLQWDMLYPTSPSSTFKTDKSYNMDISTGKASIQVPIVKAGPEEIQVPVALNYTTGGIKVRDVASWVGLGWNLSAGGKIMRLMNKFPDKLDGSMDSLLDASTWTCPTKDKKGNYSARAKIEDTQPDLFYFDILGRTGIFVLDSQGNAATIPYQNIKITYDKSAKTFDILDDTGISYSFQDVETTRVITTEGAVKRDTINYESTWNITNISGKGQSVDFEYKSLDNYSGSYEYQVYSKSMTAVHANNENNLSGVTYNLRVTPQYLTRISWNNGKIEFISSKGREDIPENAYKLDAIKIYSGTFTYNLIKSYNLEHGAFANKSLKLDKINVTTPKSTGSTFFRKFEYFTDYNLPEATPNNGGFHGYFDFDHWGYYNGENTDTGERRGYPDIEISGISHNRTYDNRTPKLAYTRANALKKVWVSSSAYDEFEYELNTEKFKYSNTEFGTIGGLRIKSITTKSTELPNSTQKVKYEYADDDKPSSGVVFKDPIYHSFTSYIVIGQKEYYYQGYYIIRDSPISSLFDLDGSHIRYGRVKEIFDNGSSNTYYYTTKADQPDAEYTNIFNKEDSSVTVTYKLLADAHSNFAPENTRFWKRGLLTKKISRNIFGIETHRETYEYKLDAPTQKTVKGIYPMVVTNLLLGKGYKPFACLIDYRYISQPFYLTKKTVSGVDVPETITEYIYDDKDNNTSDLDHILLKKTIERSGADEYTTTYKYPLDYTNIYGTEEGNAIKYMRTHNMTSAPIEIVKYKKDVIIGGELYIYGTWRYMYNGSITGDFFNLREVKELLLKKPKSQSEFTESMLSRFSVDGFRFSYDDGYVTKASYVYNRANKLNCIKERNQPSRLLLYGTNPDIPIAQITNAETQVIDEYLCEEAFYTSFEDSDGSTHPKAKTGSKVLRGGYYTDVSHLVAGTYCISYWGSYNDGVDWELFEHEVEIRAHDNRPFTIGNQGFIIDEYRIWKKGSQMQTKSYDLRSNVTSETDENGKTTYYEYDASDRLIRVLNNKRNKIKGYEYFIKN